MDVNETMKPEATDHDQTSGELNPWAAIPMVFWAPSRVFRLVRERAPIAPVYVVQMVLGVLYSVPFTILANRMTAVYEPPQSLSHQVVDWAWVVIWGMMLPWLSGLVMAVFLRLSGLLLRSGQRPSFRQYLSAAGYVRVPAVLSAGLAIPMLIRNIGVDNALHEVDEVLSAAVLAPGASPTVSLVLRLIAPLVIWQYVLVAFALAALHRTRLRRAAWVAALLWALASLVRTVWYAMPP